MDVSVEVYCSRCGSWDKREIDEREVAACSRDGNVVERYCERCLREVEEEFNARYPAGI